MSRAVVLGLTLLIGALAVLVLWLEPAGRTGLARAERESVPQEEAEPDGAPSLLRAEERDPARPGSSEETADVQADPSHAAERARAPDRRPRIEGVVRVPGGIPAGEAVRVRAEVFPASESGGPRKFAVPVASDGSFTLVVAEDTSHASLDLESRFLVLGEPVVARPGETDVVLGPLVYASIEGEVVPPQSLSTLGVSWADMEVSWLLRTRRDLGAEAMLSAMRSPSHHEGAEPDHDGAFVLPYVPVGIELELHAKNPFGPEWIQGIGPLGPAERMKITIALELGITISGRVLDEHGQPVEGLVVSADKEEHMSLRPGGYPKTDAGGRFVLARMPRRVTEISARGPDLVRGAEATIDGTNGDVLGVVLTVVRGGCIEGTVVWADGSPVEFFKVKAIGVADFQGGQGQDGRFRLSGLGDGSYRVEVRAKGDGVVGTATALDVQVGAAPLELVLEEERAFEARGVVVDREGAPVRRFSVSATGPAPEHRRESADGFDGCLLLIGLAPGEWWFEVSASGHQAARQQVVVGEGMAPLRFELMPAGLIRGRVVDSAGAPVAKAWVGEEEDVGIGFPAPRPGSDAEGRFELQPSSTRARILATKPGFSPSDVQECEVGPGETLEGIVLRLRETCRVVGRVLDEHGDPLPRASVTSNAISSMGAVKADALGVFELDGLPPGTKLLFGYHPGRDGLAWATVTLLPGQSASVDLRFEQPDPVLVHGRVTRGGKPVECNFGLLGKGFASECASGSDGRFEVTLQRPGEWRGTVWLVSESFSLPDPTRIDVRHFKVSVPDADQHAFELEFNALPRLNSMEELLR